MTDSGKTLFAQLRDTEAEAWRAYTEHAFIAQLARGDLPEPAFRHYLGQDYLFLIHFARAYALAVYKSETLADMRAAAEAMSGILDVEMGLHVAYCADWGLSETDMEALPEDNAVMAYTRFVLERGMAGDVLDLHVALAPCVLGYGEIGKRLAGDTDTLREGNPYWPWIEMYASEDYQALCRSAESQLDRLFQSRGGPGRLDGLRKTFRQATRLEADFWQMGLDAA